MELDSSKIMFIINRWDVGGAAKMLKFVSHLLESKTKEVLIVSIYDDKRSDDISSNIKCIGLSFKCDYIAWRYSLIRQIRKVVNKESPDIICSFISDVCVMARIATLGLSTTFISAERGDPFTLPIIWRYLVRWTYWKSDYCFFQLEEARDFFGFDMRNKAFVIPNAYENPRNTLLFDGERKKTIVGAGRFVKEKRFDVLIKAFAIVHNKYPNYKLKIFGKGPCLEQYRKIVREMDLSDSVTFPGYVNNLAEAIAEDGIFVLSSEYEGIPNTLIEALSVGIPTVSTDCTPGGPAFLTKKGKNGLLVQVDNISEMANAICKIIDDSALAKKLSTKGPEIISELDPILISKMWLDAFKTISSNM